MKNKFAFPISLAMIAGIVISIPKFIEVAGIVCGSISAIILIISIIGIGSEMSKEEDKK